MRDHSLRKVVSGFRNNTYQYIIAREDVHLSWLEGAIRELEAQPDDVAEPVVAAPGRRESFAAMLNEDAQGAEALVTRWRPRLAEVTHARHRNMMQVILGETMEHKRFFDQMLAGRDDLLGRRANGPGSPGTGDGVLEVRWIE